MTKIFIETNPGFYNKGDASLVTGAIKTLTTIEESEISLRSINPDFDSNRCNVKLIRSNTKYSRSFVVKISAYFIQTIEHAFFSYMNRLFKIKTIPKIVISREILEEFYHSDLIVSGLDDSFTTLYGPDSFLRIINSIAISKILNKHIILYAGSIGPFKNKLYEYIGRYFINKVDLITLREELSYNYLKRIGTNNPHIYVTADLAFCMEPASMKRAKEIISDEKISIDKRPLIGFSLSRVISKWAFPELKDSEEKYQKYIAMMANVVDYVIETYSATIVFIPQVIGPDKNTDDRITAENICNLAKNKEHIYQIRNEYSPEELRAITGLFDLLISSRTHAAISAAMMHIPFVAIEYESHKTRGIVGRMMECNDLVYDIRELNLESIYLKINYVWNNREKISERVKLKTDYIKNKASYNGILVNELLISKNRN